MDEAREAFFEEARDYTSAKLSMWLFILSELLLFGGMFILYSVYRYKNPADFPRDPAVSCGCDGAGALARTASPFNCCTSEARA